MSPEEKENQLYQQIDAVCNRLIYWKEKYIKLAELCAENKCKCQDEEMSPAMKSLAGICQCGNNWDRARTATCPVCGYK